MSEIWFTSDHHFGHKNILEYEKEYRSFKDIKEMHDVLISRWNDVVKPNDIVYHLGDFAFGKHNIAIASSLYGKKKLIMGNHDTYVSSDYLRYFDKLYGVKYWERCILTHVPIHPNNLGSKWFLNVHGHLHSRNIKFRGLKDHCDFFGIPSKSENDQNYFNVSVEQNNLYPINADVIRKRCNDLREFYNEMDKCEREVS